MAVAGWQWHRWTVFNLAIIWVVKNVTIISNFILFPTQYYLFYILFYTFFKKKETLTYKYFPIKTHNFYTHFPIKNRHFPIKKPIISPLSPPKKQPLLRLKTAIRRRFRRFCRLSRPPICEMRTKRHFSANFRPKMTENPPKMTENRPKMTEN
jgi:hypothetical protein